MAIFLVFFGIGDSLFVYAQTWQGLQFGTWYELLWTIPRMVMVWLATSWVAPKEPDPALKESSSESLLLAQFAHIRIPLISVGDGYVGDWPTIETCCGGCAGVVRLFQCAMAAEPASAE